MGVDVGVGVAVLVVVVVVLMLLLRLLPLLLLLWLLLLWLLVLISQTSPKSSGVEEDKGGRKKLDEPESYSSKYLVKTASTC